MSSMSAEVFLLAYLAFHPIFRRGVGTGWLLDGLKVDIATGIKESDKEERIAAYGDNAKIEKPPASNFQRV